MRMNHCLNDYRLLLKNKEYLPLIIGGMGVNISTDKMALAAANKGAIGHISDAIVYQICDSMFGTSFLKNRQARYIQQKATYPKDFAQFDLEKLYIAQKQYIQNAMDQKQQDKGGIFVNIMEKLTMNNPSRTLKTRLNAALDAGVDGISLSAGLHLYSLSYIAENPRFRDVALCLVISSARALRAFLKSAKKFDRLPDCIVVEGPLAGGHLGFHIDKWKEATLQNTVIETLDFLKKEGLSIPVAAAGGIFTGTDAVNMINQGVQAIQVATRFTVSEESGLPSKVKQVYFQAHEEDVLVNLQSPTGYPMRMLASSPCIETNMVPNCERYGYLLDRDGYCSYLDTYTEKKKASPDQKICITDKTCLCTYMTNFQVWTCGHSVYRLKETSNLLPNGEYQELPTSHIIDDYLFSTNGEIRKPSLP